MNIKTIKKEGYNLHLIKNKDFKTTLIKAIFWEKIRKEDLTLRNMLVNNLLFSSFNYPTLKKMAEKEEDLYGAHINGGTYRKGNYIFSEFLLSVIDDKYTEENLVTDAISFFFDVLLNPNVKDDKFEENAFNIIYDKIKTIIESDRENPNYYSLMKYKSLLSKDKPFTYDIEGNLKDLEKITSSNLYEYYQTFLKTNNIDIFIIGDKVSKDLEKFLDKIFILPKKISSKKEELYLTYQKEYSKKEEKSNFNQSKLIMGGSLRKLSNYEKKYPALVYNIILGNSPNSKLFKNVREKHSFAYSISSSINRLDGMFYVFAGISYENYEATKKEVEKELNKMKNGKFTKQDMKSAKESLLSILKEIPDFQNAIVDSYFNNLYLDADEVKEQIANIKKITKEDVIAIAKKIDIDTIFLLKEQEK